MGNVCNVSEKDMGPIINPIWDPFKTHFHSLCGSHMGPIIQPTWILYGTYIHMSGECSTGE